MIPIPAKRARRSSSPSTSPSNSRPNPPRPPSSASPSQPILPPPTPSAYLPSPSFPPSAPAGPSNWQSSWKTPRLSLGARSPSSAGGESPKPEVGDEGSEFGGTVRARDVISRPPRSMMACTRCRRQKMKCDGPSQVPCRGCRASGSTCVFEARSRPKSLSVVPSRPSPFFAGPLRSRPSTPTGVPGFFPSGPQLAPPITTSRPEPYALRHAREPMPPPPATSISAITSLHPAPQLRPLSPPIASSSTATPYHQSLTLPTPSFSSTTGQRPNTSSSESRLNTLESAMRSQSNTTATMQSMQASIEYLQRSHDSLIAVQLRNARARETVIEVPETVWEAYRSRAWPLTPWLVGLREAQGLPGLVVNWLGKRIRMESRREGENAIGLVMIEVGRLAADRVDWTREEIRALGVLATWSKDTTLACLAIGLARTSGLNRIFSSSRTQDDWREWIYLSIMDQLCQVPDLQEPLTSDILAPAWRDRLMSLAPGDSAVRDRDLKLLAWLEYSETLVEVYRAQQRSRLASSVQLEVVTEETTSEIDEREREQETSLLPRSRSGGATDERERETERRRAMEPWRKWATKWEAWAGSWAARNDLILSLHFSYAVLFTASPMFLADAGVWGDLAQSHDGYQQLERGRDAAAAVIHAICSPEIRPTLPYSFPLYRPLLAHALSHLISLVISLPDSPLISLSFVQTVLRAIYEALVEAQPVDQTPNSLIAEMVETGHLVGLGKKEVLGVEPGRQLWRRILG